MIIKDKEIISIGTTLFNDVHQFKYACSDYFKLRSKGLSHNCIKEYLDLNKMQETLLKTCWETPEYRKGYEDEPWVIIMPVTIPYLYPCNKIRENFTSFEIFRSKMFDFMYLRFTSVPLSEIQHSLELSDMQLSILLNIFGYMSKQIIEVLENAYSEGV